MLGVVLCVVLCFARVISAVTITITITITAFLIMITTIATATRIVAIAGALTVPVCVYPVHCILPRFLPLVIRRIGTSVSVVGEGGGQAQIQQGP